SIGLLAAGVAHEVNTPLTGISSFTQMLLEGADPSDPRTALLEKIERQTFRAAKIVNGLLNLSRPGTSSNERIEVDLNAVVTDVFALLEHQFEAGSIKVGRELSAAPVLGSGIEHQLQQVFLNLFLNARDAIPRPRSQRCRVARIAGAAGAALGRNCGRCGDARGPGRAPACEEAAPPPPPRGRHQGGVTRRNRRSHTVQRGTQRPGGECIEYRP